MRFIQLSDLHIGKSTNFDKVGEVIDWIIAEKDLHEARVVAISGDTVDDGARWQFDLARGEIERLRDAGFTVLIAPGNHDYGPQGVAERKKSQEWFAELISGVKDYPHLEVVSGTAFVVLDSMKAEIENIEFWGAQGELGRKQLQHLDKLLDELADNPAVENVVLLMHHHPFDYKFYHGLRDHADLKGVVSRRMNQPPRVNALIFGHKHLDKRFNDPEENKESLFGIDLIYASGQTVERGRDGGLTIPVIDLNQNKIQRYSTSGDISTQAV